MLLSFVSFIRTFMDDCVDLTNPSPPVDYHPGLKTMKEVENILKNDGDITASPVKVVKEKVAETEAIDAETGETVSILENVGDKTGDFLKNVGSKLKTAKDDLEQNVNSTIKNVIDDAADKVTKVRDEYAKKTEELGEKAKDMIDKEVLSKLNEGEITKNLEEREDEALGGIKGVIDRADELLNRKLKESEHVVEKRSTDAGGEVTTDTVKVTHPDGTFSETVKVKHPDEHTVVTASDETGAAHTDTVITSSDKGTSIEKTSVDKTLSDTTAPDKTSSEKTQSDKKSSDKPKETIEKRKETLPDGTKATTEIHKKEEQPKETTTAVNGVHTDTLLDKLQALRDKFKKHADLDVKMNSVGDDVYYPKIDTLVYELAGIERDMEKMRGG
ncbi:hypothetical protein VCUG_01842 [Vavraia culicis subsp. floridensis]|uniref:Uncharacterized protein n=1 Tax=Vavraia culicis (isolate floridensis) TaxID=948595 RepID=L2GTI7_VAVCU|nr:uncharacterized protein VCUG_01842 [Vavraia culicis subsp. floridensis]ELA46692.1 hypothetical protein VCUG_01842 [Vavraia culicis subsp. floridensis]